MINLMTGRSDEGPPTEAEIRTRLAAAQNTAAVLARSPEPVVALFGRAWTPWFKRLESSCGEWHFMQTLVEIEYAIGKFALVTSMTEKLRLRPDLSLVERLILKDRFSGAADAFEEAFRKERDAAARHGTGMSAGGRKAHEAKHGGSK